MTKKTPQEALMTRISYVNGEFLDHEKAFVHIEDRGFQFADAAYEGIACFNGKILDFDPHMARLKRSLNELGIEFDADAAGFRPVMEKLAVDNGLEQAFFYLQISRGRAPRNHAFPVPHPVPTVVITASPLDLEGIATRQKKGVKIVLLDENRWTRPDIKSTSLLGNVLAKQAACEADAYEAVYVGRDGNITEGTSSNIWIIAEDGTLVTRKTDGAILAGVTRGSVMNGITGVEKRSFSKEELLAAPEVFLTSTTSLVMPVVQIDDVKVGNGKPGPGTEKLKKVYEDYIREQTGFEA